MRRKLKPVRLPKHLLANKGRLFKLRKFANSIRAFYGLPVYLCGSALLENNPEPRDWDIRLEMPDKDFALRFGDPKKWRDEGFTGEYTRIRWGWSDECVKRTKSAWRETGLNIDFQIYPRVYCKELGYDRQPKARLDTRGQSTK